MKKHFELITIPIAAMLLIAYNWLAEAAGLHPFTWEMFAKVFVAFLIFLVSMGFVRIVFIFLFPNQYRYFDSSFSNSKMAWLQLSEKERFIASAGLFCLLLLVFALIVNGL